MSSDGPINPQPPEGGGDFYDNLGARWTRAHSLGCLHWHRDADTECGDGSGLVEPGAIPPELGPITAHPPERYARMARRRARPRRADLPPGATRGDRGPTDRVASEEEHQ